MKTFKVMVNRGTGTVRIKYLDPEFGCWFWIQDEWGYPLDFGTAVLARRWVEEHERMDVVDEQDERWVEVTKEGGE